MYSVHSKLVSRSNQATVTWAKLDLSVIICSYNNDICIICKETEDEEHGEIVHSREVGDSKKSCHTPNNSANDYFFKISEEIRNTEQPHGKYMQANTSKAHLRKVISTTK